jgi:hypothetical protein
MILSKHDRGQFDFYFKEITARGNTKYDTETNLKDNFYCITKIHSHLAKFGKTFLPIHAFKVMWYLFQMMRNNPVEYQK